ncbi:glutathione peroxidase [soil metagenome]
MPTPSLTAFDFTATSIDGREVALSDFAGQVLLVVNVASQCGFTPQYEGLEQLHQTYAEQGLTVLGFPCDQFGNQEPGSEADIQQFCSTTFSVSFPMFAKVEVNGDGAHPLYRWLRAEQSGLLGDKIKWNFTKFLVGRDGAVRARWGSSTKPEKLTSDIEQALAA